MPHRVKIITTLTASPERTADLDALLERHARLIRAHPGSLRWDVWRDRQQVGRYLIDQLYTDGDAVAAYYASDDHRSFVSDLTHIAEHQDLCCTPVVL